eukprot:2676021-Pleurochrysis_carterae.AAC.1
MDFDFEAPGFDVMTLLCTRLLRMLCDVGARPVNLLGDDKQGQLATRDSGREGWKTRARIGRCVWRLCVQKYVRVHARECMWCSVYVV